MMHGPIHIKINETILIGPSVADKKGDFLTLEKRNKKVKKDALVWISDPLLLNMRHFCKLLATQFN